MLAALTPRERQVLLLIARGMSTDEVAAELAIGVTTVRTHVYRLRCKLDVKDRAQMVSVAYRSGLMSPRVGRESLSQPNFRLVCGLIVGVGLSLRLVEPVAAGRLQRRPARSMSTVMPACSSRNGWSPAIETNRSGTPDPSTRRPVSASASATAPPSPPARQCSSTVTTGGRHARSAPRYLAA